MLASAAALNAQPKDTWVFYEITWTPPTNGFQFAFIINGGASIGQGFDIALPRVQVPPVFTAEPMAFWDVDNAANPFRWTDQSLAYQGFINAVLPGAQPFGNNPTPCYDTAPFFWDVPNQYGIYFIDPPGTAALGATTVYNAVKSGQVRGHDCVGAIRRAPPPASWDQPGLSWDQPGVLWQ